MIINSYSTEAAAIVNKRNNNCLRGVYRDYYIDHENKDLPHIEFDNIEYLNIMRLRWNYIPNDVIYDVMFRNGFEYLFEGEE